MTIGIERQVQRFRYLKYLSRQSNLKFASSHFLVRSKFVQTANLIPFSPRRPSMLTK